jgi:hypothetical protein
MSLVALPSSSVKLCSVVSSFVTLNVTFPGGSVSAFGWNAKFWIVIDVPPAAALELEPTAALVCVLLELLELLERPGLEAAVRFVLVREQD